MASACAATVAGIGSVQGCVRVPLSRTLSPMVSWLTLTSSTSYFRIACGTIGCCTTCAARASRRKRRRDSASFASSWRTLMATLSSVSMRVASHTTPMPPCPSGSFRRYLAAMTVPDANFVPITAGIAYLRGQLRQSIRSGERVAASRYCATSKLTVPVDGVSGEGQLRRDECPMTTESSLVLVREKIGCGAVPGLRATLTRLRCRTGGAFSTTWCD